MPIFSTDEIIVAPTNKIEIKSSSISGDGTFAIKSIHAGELVTTLTGRMVISSNISQIGPEFGVTIDDPLQISDNQFLILHYASKKINHSCDPNTGIRNQSDLYALKNIDVEDEITFDYSTTSGLNDAWTMPCNCRAKNCRKIIGNISTIPKRILSYYMSKNCLPDFIKQQLKAKKTARLKEGV